MVSVLTPPPFDRHPRRTVARRTLYDATAALKCLRCSSGSNLRLQGSGGAPAIAFRGVMASFRPTIEVYRRSAARVPHGQVKSPALCSFVAIFHGGRNFTRITAHFQRITHHGESFRPFTAKLKVSLTHVGIGNFC